MKRWTEWRRSEGQRSDVQWVPLGSFHNGGEGEMGDGVGVAPDAACICQHMSILSSSCINSLSYALSM